MNLGLKGRFGDYALPPGLPRQWPPIRKVSGPLPLPHPTDVHMHEIRAGIVAYAARP